MQGFVISQNSITILILYGSLLCARFYKTDYLTTPHDKGTFISAETSFGKVPKHNIKAAKDFLDVLLCAIVLTAAKQVMTSLVEKNGIYLDCKDVTHLAKEQFVKISIPQLEEESTDATAGNDGVSVHKYATDFLTIAPLWYGSYQNR